MYIKISILRTYQGLIRSQYLFKAPKYVRAPSFTSQTSTILNDVLKNITKRSAYSAKRNLMRSSASNTDDFFLIAMVELTMTFASKKSFSFTINVY